MHITEISSQYDHNTVWFYNGNNGTMNYNNKFYSNHARGLVEFRQNEVPLSPRSLNFVIMLYEAYFACRKNKRKTHTQIAFEINYPNNLRRIANELLTCEYVPRKSIAFVITKPKIREVMASSFRDRVVQTYYVMRLMSLIDKTINKHSYSCRVSKGGLAAEVLIVWGDVLTVADDYSKFSVKEQCKTINKKVKLIQNYRLWINKAN